MQVFRNLTGFSAYSPSDSGYLKTTDASGPTVTDIYVTGYYNNGGDNIACYWKNGIRTDLVLGSMHNYGRNIFVNTNGVYVSGQANYKPCFWANNVRSDIGTEQGDAYAIADSNQTRYITGRFSTSGPFLLTNDELQLLPGGSNGGQANGLFIHEYTTYD